MSEGEVTLAITINNSVPRELNRMHWSRKLVEIPTVLYFIAFGLGGNVYSNLIIYRTCMVTFGYNETTCSALVASSGSNETKHIEEEVQNYASKIVMEMSFLTGICPAILSLFLGPWSDVNGRKPLIISSMMGYCSFFCISILFTQLESLDPLWFLLPAVPSSLMGGLSSLITGCFCYISDITDVSNRSFRMVTLEGYLLTGILAGSLLSPYVFNAFGYTVIFGACAVITFIGSLYSIFMYESLPEHEIKKCSIFNKHLVTGMLKVSFQRRTNYKRAIIWLVMLSSSFGIFAQEGEMSVTYYFVRAKLSWELKQFSWYSAFSILTTVFGTIIVTFLFQKLLKMGDSLISMIAYLLSGLKSIIITLASQTWHMYLSCAITGPRAAFGPSNRAILSKTIPHEDVGKVLSLTTSLETILPLISAPVYSILYRKTLTTFPGAYNLISMGLYGISFMFILIVNLIQRRHPDNDYDLLTNASVEN